MSDSSDEAQAPDAPAGDGEQRPHEAETGRERPPDTADDRDLDALRSEVEEKYDFDNFGPSDMAEMSPEEWEAAFDADAWITGDELLDRVEADLRSRVANRDVFAVVERLDGEPGRLVAYSDKSYAIVYSDGTIEGEGAVLRDVKPTVALASMPEYEVPDAPEDAGLPSPEAIDEASSSVGNWMVLLVAGAMLVSALGLFGATLLADLGGAAIVAATVGFVFLLVALGLFLTVANARLSARYRADEYRERLRGAGVEQGERPSFLPIDETAFDDGPALEGEEDSGDGDEEGTSANDSAGEDSVDPDAEVDDPDEDDNDAADSEDDA